MKQSTALSLTRAAVTAAVYFSVTAIFSPISFGFLQLRLSECLCVLPLFFPEAGVGLIVGCFLSNALFSTPQDVFFGTLATVLSALLTCFTAKKVKNRTLKFMLCGLYSAAFNGLIVPLGFMLFSFSWAGYFIAAAQIAVCEALSVFVAGGVLCYFLAKYFKAG